MKTKKCSGCGQVLPLTREFFGSSAERKMAFAAAARLAARKHLARRDAGRAGDASVPAVRRTAARTRAQSNVASLVRVRLVLVGLDVLFGAVDERPRSAA